MLLQSIEFLSGPVFELFEETLLVILDLLVALSGKRDDPLFLGKVRRLDLDFDLADEIERRFDVLASILHLLDQGGCLDLLLFDDIGDES